MYNQQFGAPAANSLGYNYGVQRPQARNTQPLTAEQINQLRSSSESFSMRVTQEELLRAACTHKEKNGQSSLRVNEDGTCTCSICHKTFRMSELTPEQVQERVNDITDILETIKTIYLDAPEELIKQFFQIEPLLQKLIELWKMATRNFAQYDEWTPEQVQYHPGYSGFNAMATLLSNPYGAVYGQPYGGYPQQPAAGYGYPVQPAAPMAAPAVPQPMYAPVAPVAPGVNPLAYGTPAAPVAPAPGVMPAAPAPAQAPAAAPAPQATEVQQQQVFNV